MILMVLLQIQHHTRDYIIAAYPNKWIGHAAWPARLLDTNPGLLSEVTSIQTQKQNLGCAGKVMRDAIGLLRTVGERYLKKNKEVYTVFVDLEKAFDRVDWNKLMRILKKISVDWKEKAVL
ncbi:hypothetical protein ANN_10236 [Periplaneta americana]|uniref:Reverse transcriptase domain-containing protein n=1 Tax=Periplaneta americana TaxID=6978 RepID=A0ABQ8TQC1_PERAM|nr:hypothetical protein ANN_10236 [Periplaneta americana]